MVAHFFMVFQGVPHSQIQILNKLWNTVFCYFNITQKFTKLSPNEPVQIWQSMKIGPHKKWWFHSIFHLLRYIKFLLVSHGKYKTVKKTCLLIFPQSGGLWPHSTQDGAIGNSWSPQNRSECVVVFVWVLGAVYQISKQYGNKNSSVNLIVSLLV